MLSPKWTASRTARRLDGLWEFTFDHSSRGLAEQWWRGALPGSRPMPVPASFNDLTTDLKEREYVGNVWYQTVVATPDSPGRRTVLRFDAATHRAEVWLDETRLGTHEGGYTPFEFDVTEIVRGREAVRLTARVDNRLTMHSIPPGLVDVGPDGRCRQRYFHDFFNYAGLSRSVWLLTTPRSYIDDITVRTDLDGARGVVRYEVLASDGHDASGNSAERTAVVLLDAQGNEVATADGLRGELELDPVRPWSPDDPHLYTLRVTHESGGETDVYPVRVGVRTVAVDGTQLLLNGAPVELHGFGMHEDAPWRGKGHDDARMVRDFTLMQWIGANSFRTSHYPYAEEVLDLADRLGFLVVDETAAVGLNLALNAGRVHVEDTRTFRPGGIDETSLEVHLDALHELVARDKNHPSVVMWSVANEPDTTEPASRPYFEALADLTRRLDPTRPVAFANVAGATPETDQVTDLFDVILLNRYFGWYVDAGEVDVAASKLEDELQLWAKRYGKPIVVSEFGADAVAGVHSLPAQMWSEEYQQDLIATYLDVFARVGEVVGAHVWNFADFATMQGTNRVVGNRKGVFTRDREPKAVAYLLRERWAARP